VRRTLSGRAHRSAVFLSDGDRGEHLFALYEKRSGPLAHTAETKPARARKAEKAATSYTQAEADAAHHQYFVNEGPPTSPPEN
jgi:hypothetical protein